MAVQKKIDIPFDIPLPVALDDSFSVFNYNPFRRRYYKDIWQPTVGDDSLHYEERKDNEYDKHTVAIIYYSFHSKKAVGHVPFYYAELANKFLKFLNNYIRVAVTGKRVNKGIGLGLKIPVDYFFHGDNRVIKWFKKSIEKLDKCNNVKVKKCMKSFVKSVYLLKFFKIAQLFYHCFMIYPKISVCYREVNFKATDHAVPKNSVRVV